MGGGPLAMGAGDRFGTGAGYDGPAGAVDGDGRGFETWGARGCGIFTGLEAGGGAGTVAGARDAILGESTELMPRGDAAGLDGIGAAGGAALGVS